jgi:serine/threonine protein kinase
MDIYNKMLAKKENLSQNIYIINQGYTSSTFVSPHLFIKYIIRCQDRDVYEREKYIASKLKNFDWFPKLLHYDDINQFFIFSNVGVPVTSINKPDDLEQQFETILQDMRSVNVQHNDIKIGELLIDENQKVYLCDFGWGSVNNELGCGIGLWNCNNKQKPGGYNDDATTLKRLNLI